MKSPLGLSMQVTMDMLPYSKGTMSKPTASGIARMSDSTQMVTISMIVSRGMPTP